MAANDVKIYKSPYDSVPTRTYQTEAGATDILAGEPLKLKTAGDPYAIPLATLDLTIGTDTQFVGIAATNSDHTATADGTVEVYLPMPGIVYSCAATTSTNFDTAAEIAALENDRVVFTLAAGVYTIDENAGDGANNAFYIVGGDADNALVYFQVRLDATVLSGESV